MSNSEDELLAGMPKICPQHGSKLMHDGVCHGTHRFPLKQSAAGQRSKEKIKADYANKVAWGFLLKKGIADITLRCYEKDSDMHSSARVLSSVMEEFAAQQQASQIISECRKIGCESIDEVIEGYMDTANVIGSRNSQILNLQQQVTELRSEIARLKSELSTERNRADRWSTLAQEVGCDDCSKTIAELSKASQDRLRKCILTPIYTNTSMGQNWNAGPGAEYPEKQKAEATESKLAASESKLAEARKALAAADAAMDIDVTKVMDHEQRSQFRVAQQLVKAALAATEPK